MTVLDIRRPSIAMAAALVPQQQPSGSSISTSEEGEESFHPSVASDLLDGVLCDDELNGTSYYRLQIKVVVVVVAGHGSSIYLLRISSENLATYVLLVVGIATYFFMLLILL